MSTAHQVLAEVKATRVSEQTREEEQKKLFGHCWFPRHLVVIMAIWGGMSCVHLGFLLAQHLKDPMQSRLWLVVTAFTNIVLATGACVTLVLRRNAALIELIRQKAPALHEELSERRVL